MRALQVRNLQATIEKLATRTYRLLRPAGKNFGAIVTTTQFTTTLVSNNLKVLHGHACAWPSALTLAADEVQSPQTQWSP